MSGVPPPPPEGFTLDGAPPADASNRLAGVNGTAPQAGADASTYGPQVGVHPDVALQMPVQVKQAATLRSAQATVAASPSLSSWLAGASNATLANVQDSLPHLAGIGTQVATFQAAPWASWFAGAQSALTAQEREGMAPRPWWDVLGPGQIRGASDLLQTAGIAAGGLAAGAEGGFAPLIGAGQQGVLKLLGMLPLYTQPTTLGGLPTPTPTGEQTSQQALSGIGTALLGLMPAGAASGQFFLRRANPIDLGTVPSEPAGPRGLSGPPGAFHPPPEVPAEVEPSPYVSSPTLPPVGAAPEVDALRGATAEFDAQHVANIQEAIAQAPVFARSPEVVQDFIEQTHPGAVASVDPERLTELAQQGHIPFPELSTAILRSAADGSDVEVPLARYLVATAGQPYAAALNAAATFREGGTSVEQAKGEGGVAAGGPSAAVETDGPLEAMHRDVGNSTIPSVTLPPELAKEREELFGPLEAEQEKALQAVQRGEADTYPYWADLVAEAMKDPAWKARFEAQEKQYGELEMQRRAPAAEAYQRHLPPGWTARRSLGEGSRGTPYANIYIHDPEGRMVIGEGAERSLWEQVLAGRKPPTPAEEARMAMGKEAPANDTELDELGRMIEEATTKKTGEIVGIHGEVGTGGENILQAPEDQVAYHQRMSSDETPRQIVYMSPDDYLRTTQELNPNLPHEGPVAKLQARLQEEGLQNVPWLHYKDGKLTAQEGRHRAAALKAMGYSKIPVAVVGRRPGVLSSGGIGAQRVGGGEGFTPMEQERLDALQRANVLAAQQAMRASFLTHLVEDPKALGMSKEEFARYSESLATVQSGIVNKMQERALRVVKREREPEFKAAAALHAIPAREGLEALPAVRAMRALSEPGMKLDRDLVQNFYPGNAGRLPAGVLKANANHPDNAAEALGFGSGGELVQALADLHEARTASGAKSLDAYLNMQAHEYGVAKAREQFGYDLSPQANYEAAAELVHAPDVKRFLADELRHLSPAFNEYDVDNYVRVRFEGMTVRLARNTRKLTELAYKNGVKAQRALQKGDVPGAFKFRQAQYIQHQLSAKSIEFQKELRKGQKLIGRIADEVSLPGVDQTHLNWAKDVVATTGKAVTGNPVDLKRPIGGYATLDDFIRAKVNAGGTIIRAPVPVSKAVGDMTVREFGGLSDMLESMLQNGRREGTIDIEGKRQALAEFVASALPRFERYTKTITEEERNSPTFLQKVEAARRGVDAWLVRFSQLMKDFSGGDPRSPFMQMDSQLKAAEGNDRDMRVWTAGHLKALNKTVGKGWQAWLKMRLPTEGAHKFVATTRDGDPIFNTGMDVVMAALHMGDEEALSRFAEGYNSTPQDIENVVHQFATPQMWKFVHGMWDLFAHFKPDIEALYKRETNVTPKMVEPRPFTRMEGGVEVHEPGAYFPVIYDTVANPSDFVEALDPEELLGERHYVRATPANGYIKERTGSAGMVQRQLGTVYSRINQVIHDLAYREALANANKFLSHPDIQSTISRKYGPEYVAKLRANLQRIAGAEAGEMTNNAKVARAAAQWMTEGQMVNMIGYSPKTIMKHIGTVIPQAVAEVGPKRFAQAYADFLANHDARAAQALAESPALRHMVANYSEDGYRQWLALTEKSGISNQIRAFAFHGISNIQRHIGTALYFAAKQKLEDRFPGMSEEALRAGANHSVEQVTGSAGLIDTPESLTAGRDVPGAFYRMGNNFLTFLSHMYNRSREIPQNLGYAGDKVDLGRALATLLVNIVLPILIDQEVDKRFGKAIWDIGMWGEGMIHQFISPVPGANTTVAAGMHIATGGEFSTEESAAASFGTQVGNTALDIKHFAEGKSLDNRAVQHALTLAGQVLHLPGAEAARLEGFLHDLTTNSKPVDELVKELLLGPGPQPHTSTHHFGRHQ